MAIHVTRVTRTREGQNPNVINLLGDVTGSMDEINKEGIQCDAFNEVLVPALRGAHPDRKDVLRVSLGAFSDGKIEGLTNGYVTLDELAQRPVRNNQLYKPGLNRSTTLYASIIKAIKSCYAATQIVRSMMTIQIVKAHVAFMTDGANYTNDPTTTKDVRQALQVACSNGVDMRLYIAYFRTSGGLSENGFRSVAKECGVLNENCYFWNEHGSTLSEQRKAFRHMVKILSSRF